MIILHGLWVFRGQFHRSETSFLQYAVIYASSCFNYVDISFFSPLYLYNSNIYLQKQKITHMLCYHLRNNLLKKPISRESLPNSSIYANGSLLAEPLWLLQPMHLVGAVAVHLILQKKNSRYSIRPYIYSLYLT